MEGYIKRDSTPGYIQPSLYVSMLEKKKDRFGRVIPGGGGGGSCRNYASRFSSREETNLDIPTPTHARTLVGNIRRSREEVRSFGATRYVYISRLRYLSRRGTLRRAHVRVPSLSSSSGTVRSPGHPLRTRLTTMPFCHRAATL